MHGRTLRDACPPTPWLPGTECGGASIRVEWRFGPRSRGLQRSNRAEPGLKLWVSAPSWARVAPDGYRAAPHFPSDVMGSSLSNALRIADGKLGPRLEGDIHAS